MVHTYLVSWVLSNRICALACFEPCGVSFKSMLHIFMEKVFYFLRNVISES